MFNNFKRMLLTLYRIEEGQQEILAALAKLGTTPQSPCGDSPPDKGGQEWLQAGIDNILSYQAGKKVKK